MMPLWRIAPPQRSFSRFASLINCALPASTAPPGAPRPFEKSIQTAAADGYVTVLTTRDSDDWRRLGAAHIESASHSGASTSK